MPIGIRPTNDFAFKKTFGSPANKLALVSLLNAILDLPIPIADVTIENPFNLQDFHDDKLSILDIRAVDQRGAIYDIEMQLSIFSGLVKRIVFYGCEVYAGQLKAGDDYKDLKPVYSICLLEGRLWQDSNKVHHAFRFADHDSGRFLAETLEIHTLELGCYNLGESDLDTASILDRWLFWLLHAHEYDSKTLTGLFPQPAFQQATNTITRIAEITEDKAMYDTREKAIRDRQWALNASREEALEEGLEKGLEQGLEQGREEGEIKGEIKLIRTLQEILGEPISEESSLKGQSLDRLQSITVQLRNKIHGRTS